MPLPTLGAGLQLAPQLLVAPANGGGTFTLSPGVQTISGLFLDSSGRLTLEYVSGDVVGTPAGQLSGATEGVGLTLLSAQQTVLDTAAILLQTPLLYFQSSSVASPGDPIEVNVFGRARLLQGNDPAEIVTAPGAQLLIQAFDQLGNPTNAVTINGAPGSQGVEVTLDANGNAQLSVVQLDPGVQARLRAFYVPAWLRDGDVIEHPELGEFVIAGRVVDELGNLVMLSAVPLRECSAGDSTCVLSRECPPPYTVVFLPVMPETNPVMLPNDN